jgi:hypothetical protein
MGGGLGLGKKKLTEKVSKQAANESENSPEENTASPAGE